MKKIVKVYIASPYTEGDAAQNVRLQINFANKLMNEGFYPYTPLLSHFHHMIYERTYDDWMDHCMVWVDSCDCLLRVGGNSKGAEKEIEHAKDIGIPIFYNLNDLLTWYYRHN